MYQVTCSLKCSLKRLNNCKFDFPTPLTNRAAFQLRVLIALRKRKYREKEIYIGGI